MKWRSMVLVVAAIAALLLAAGCANPQPTVLGEKDAGRVVEIGAGQQFTVRLPSNATTGFRWEVADAGAVMQVGESVYEAPQEPGIVGAGGTEVFTFRTGTSDPAELKLEYRRPGDKSSPAEKSNRGIERPASGRLSQRGVGRRSCPRRWTDGFGSLRTHEPETHESSSVHGLRTAGRSSTQRRGEARSEGR